MKEDGDLDLDKAAVVIGALRSQGILLFGSGESLSFSYLPGFNNDLSYTTVNNCVDRIKPSVIRLLELIQAARSQVISEAMKDPPES